MKIESASFEKVKEMLWGEFGSKKDMVFSTSYENDVTSRWVTSAPLDGKLYFLTGKDSRKYPQLIKNPNATLCCEGLYFKVKAKDKGATTDEKNKKIHNTLRAVFDDTAQYDTLASEPCAVFIELEVTSGELSVIEDGRYTVYACNFIKNEAVKLNFF